MNREQLCGWLDAFLQLSCTSSIKCFDRDWIPESPRPRGLIRKHRVGFRRVPSRQGPPKLVLLSTFCLPPSHGLKMAHGAKIELCEAEECIVARRKEPRSNRSARGYGFTLKL